MRRSALLLAAGVLVLGLVGYKSQPQMGETPATGTWEEPLWVTKGISAFPEEAGESLYGVGIAEKARTGMLSLQRTTAIAAGQLEIGRQLQTFVEGVFKDYSEAALSPSMDEAESQSLISNVYKTIVDETVIGAQPVDAWVHPETRDYFALVKLNMDSVASQVRQKIIAVEKDKLRIDAARAHQELDEIIEKNRQRLRD